VMEERRVVQRLRYELDVDIVQTIEDGKIHVPVCDFMVRKVRNPRWAMDSFTTANFSLTSGDCEDRHLPIKQVFAAISALNSLLNSRVPDTEQRSIFLGDVVWVGKDKRGLLTQKTPIVRHCMLPEAQIYRDFLLYSQIYPGDVFWEFSRRYNAYLYQPYLEVEDQWDDEGGNDVKSKDCH
jgi:hypothetical protein